MPNNPEYIDDGSPNDAYNAWQEALSNSVAQDQTEALVSSNEDEEIVREQERKVGAKVLSLASFHKRHRKIVESSFDKARKKEEKLSGTNDERRNLAYLQRLDALVKKRGTEIEKRLWEASAKQESLIIRPEGFTESFWKAHETSDDHPLTDQEKSAIIEQTQEQQRRSLKSWADYLGDEKTQFPMWFKLYVWDGMSKMGAKEKGKPQYSKRDSHTTAPYPDCNPEVLSAMFTIMDKYYSSSEQTGYRDKYLEEIIASGNFNRMYSIIESEKYPILATPENPEDIHGEWIEYLPGQEKELAIASKSTGWCIASETSGSGYLRSPRSKFLLFHLKDPSTGELARNGCLAIQIDENGEVGAEIRGLGPNQEIQESLIPTLEEKLKTLPGGERRLPAIEDLKQLYRLGHKIDKGEDLTPEELNFLYEINRFIHRLCYDDFHHDTTERHAEELRLEYGLEHALDTGLDPTELLISHPLYMSSSGIMKRLLEHHADINKVARNLDPEIFDCYFRVLLDYVADANQLLSIATPDFIRKRAKVLLERGVDKDTLLSKLSMDDIYFLKHHGIQIGPLKLLKLRLQKKRSQKQKDG